MSISHPKSNKVTRKGVYVIYGYQMKAYDETFLKNYFSTRMDPKCHEITRIERLLKKMFKNVYFDAKYHDGKRHDEFNPSALFGSI